MDKTVHERMVAFAESVFSEHPMLLSLAQHGDGVIQFCGVSVSDEHIQGEDEDEYGDFSEPTQRHVLRTRASFIAGGVFLTIRLDTDIIEGESVPDAIHRVYGGGR